MHDITHLSEELSQTISMLPVQSFIDLHHDLNNKLIYIIY
jgi:hypothetical protein